MKIQKKIRPTRANIRLSRHMGKENFTRNPCPFFASSRRSPSSCPSAQTIQPFFRRPPAANKNKDENNRNSISNDGSRNIINYSISQERLDSTRIQTDDNMGRPVATNQKPYFVPHRPGTSDTVRDAGDDGVYVEEVPASVDPDDFAPRLVNMRDESMLTPLQKVESIMKTSSSRQDSTNAGLLPDKNNKKNNSEGSNARRDVKFSAFEESAKKAAPKLFFAGERTFLQWMHAAVLLAGISLGISAHSDHVGSVGDWMALLLLPVAIGIMVYSMFQFSKRTYMIAARSPGPYEDRWGPVVIGSFFALSLVVQMFVVLSQQQ